MLKWLALFIGIAHSQAVVLGPQFLLHKDQPTCSQRSQQQCQALGCDGVNTVYWWDCGNGPLKPGIVGPNAVPAGSYGMRVERNGAFSSTYSSPASGGAAVGLTAEEQKNLVTSNAIAPIVPPPTAIPGP